MNHTYRVIIEPDAKGFHGYVPSLKGCHTWGKTIAETKKHLQEAVEVYLESLLSSLSVNAAVTRCFVTSTGEPR